MHINGIPVEVQGAYGEHYPAYITEISSVDLVEITFAKEHSLLPIKSRVHPTVLRVPPTIRNHEISPPKDIIVGQEVEILQEIGASLPLSWWSAIVRKSKGCFVVVDLTANLLSPQEHSSTASLEQSIVPTIPETGFVLMPLPEGISHTEVVENTQIRVHNWHTNLTAVSIFKHVLQVPSKYEQICQDPAIFEPLLEHCGPPCLVTVASEAIFKPQSDKIGILIASSQHSVVKRAAFIQNSFIASLEMRTSLIKQTKDLSQRLEHLRTTLALSAFTVEFNIPVHLANRITERNLNRAQAVEGVSSVTYNNETHAFRITGGNMEAVKRAREILEFAIDSLLVPAVYVSRLANLQDLVNRVGLGSLSIEPAGTDKPAFADFRFVGTRSAINDIKMALKFHVQGLRELDMLKGFEPPPEPALNKANNEITAIELGPRRLQNRYPKNKPVHRISAEGQLPTAIVKANGSTEGTQYENGHRHEDKESVKNGGVHLEPCNSKSGDTKKARGSRSRAAVPVVNGHI